MNLIFVTMEVIPIDVYFLLLILILLLIYLYCYNKLNYWKRKGVLQLCNTNKIFGNFKNGILFRTPPGYLFGELYREGPADAPFVGFYIFHKPCLLLRDPELVHQVLVQDFDNFCNRRFAGTQQVDSIGMTNLFGVKNPAWKYLRKRITPTLTPVKMRQMFPLLMQTAKPMMSYLKRKVNDGNETGVVDAQTLSHRYTADLIANVAFRTKTDSFNESSYYTKRVMDFFRSSKRMVALVSVFFMPELANVVGSPLLFDSSFARKMFWRAMESTERNGEQRGDYIDSIVQLKNGEQDSLYRFDGDNLLYQTGMFFSGFETSSTVTTYTLLELARNCDCQERARENIRNAIAEHGWTVEAFNEMRYLDQCIAEAARLHPPVPILDRETLQDYKIPNTDVVVEKGTPVYVSLYGLHKDPRHFEDPDVFDPRRFAGDGAASRAYLPYGAGPRKCIGIKLGQLHAKVVLSLILTEYAVYQNPEEVNKLDSRAIFTAAADGIKIEFTKLQ